jgi:hypothetical protein
MEMQNIVKDDGTVIQTEEAQENQIHKALKSYPNYVGYDEGVERIKDGEAIAGTKVLRIYVTKKKKKAELKKNEVFPAEVAGTETDVVELGFVEAQGATDYMRPFPMGVSHGNITITAGTAGGIVVKNGEKCVATNTHVGCESVRKDLSAQELTVAQPGPTDKPVSNDTIYGKTITAIIMPEGQTAYNDWAVVRPSTASSILPQLLSSHITPSGTATLAVGDLVWKEGRTTGYQVGKVTSLGASVNVSYGSQGTVLHAFCIVVQGLNGSFSAGGDSGSWVYKKVSAADVPPNQSQDSKVAAYLFAGSTTNTICHEIQNALSATNCTVFVSETPVTPTEIEVNVVLEKESGTSFRIFGKVTGTDGAGIQGATADAKYGSLHVATTTDGDGKYYIENLPYGFEYSITFSKDGYKSITKNLGQVG